MITLDQLIKAVPEAKSKSALYYPHLVSAMSEFEITTPLRQAAFLSQIYHESGNLAMVEEGLHYRAETMVRVWPSRFPNIEAAKPYAGSPQKLANRVYALRMGNGDEGSGDGFRHRGAGLIQLTGKDNQYACALDLNVDLLTIGDWLKTPEGACRSAGWFWKRSNLNIHADKGDLDAVSDLINIGRKTAKVGDSIGYAHRLQLYKSFKAVLGV